MTRRKGECKKRRTRRANRGGIERQGQRGAQKGSLLEKEAPAKGISERKKWKEWKKKRNI